MKQTHAVIMAGGVGSRFWPKSRRSLPKQFLSLLDHKTMIQESATRIRPLIDPERIWVVTTQDQAHLVRQQLDWLPLENLVFEPFGKNTAPCIGLAALHIYHRDPDAAMIVMPADHLITGTDTFLKTLSRGVELIREDPSALVTIGIEPTYPATGYGYIQRGEKIANHSCQVYRVRAFAEKPVEEVALQFFQNGEFLWNSGIFSWSAQTILNYIDEFMPELYEGLEDIRSVIGTDACQQVTERVYKQIRSQSIDYGVMEHASNVLVLEGTFGWSDVGSWDEVYSICEKDKHANVLKGNVIIQDGTRNYVESVKRLIALVGVEDLVVVDSDDAVLICNRNRSQDVKCLVEKLKHGDLKRYL